MRPTKKEGPAVIEFLAKLTPSDWTIAFATFAGPVFAVQAQKWIEALRERRNRKHWVFNQLMATRKSRLSPDHVQALNMIDLAFYGTKYWGFHWRSAEERSVANAWKEYFDALSLESNDANAAAVIDKRDNAFIELLNAIAIDVGYEFDKVQLRRGAYSPVFQERMEDQQNRLREALLAVFEGEKSLRMDVVKFPVNDAAAEAHRKMITQIVESTEGGQLKVKIQPDPAP
jgi:hypothetical protein